MQGNDYIAKINRVTGDAKIMIGSHWKEVGSASNYSDNMNKETEEKKDTKDIVIVELPKQEKNKIDPDEPFFLGDRVSGRFYNGTDEWVVTEIIVYAETKDKETEEIAKRKYPIEDMEEISPIICL